MLKNIKSYHITPFFCLVVFALTTVCGLIDTNTGSTANSVLTMLVLQLLALALPGIIYIRAQGRISPAKLGIRLFGASSVTFIIYSALFMFCATVLIRLLLINTGISQVSPDPDIASLGFTGIMAVAAVYCVIPAFVEEFVFRSIIFGEYKPYGVFGAVLLSSCLFSLYHFSLSDFFIYFFAGIVLSLVYEVTRSVFASISAHCIYNLLTVFLREYLRRIISHPDNMLPLVFIAVSCMLLFLFLALYRAQWLLKTSAVKIPESENFKYPPLATRLRSLLISLVSPGFLACIAYSAVASVIIMSRK